MKSWIRPVNHKQALIFVRQVNYYSRFIKKFSQIAYPLRVLSRSKKDFKWTAECKTAFEKLKEARISDPVMAYPRDEGQYILDTVVLGYAIGAVLRQMQPDDAGELVEKVIFLRQSPVARYSCVSNATVDVYDNCSPLWHF